MRAQLWKLRFQAELYLFIFQAHLVGELTLSQLWLIISFTLYNNYSFV